VHMQTKKPIYRTWTTAILAMALMCSLPSVEYLPAIAESVAEEPQVFLESTDSESMPATSISTIEDIEAEIDRMSEELGEPVVIANARIGLYVFPASGLLLVHDKQRKALHRSNPADAEEDTLAIDKWRSNLRSQLMVEVYDRKTTMTRLINTSQGSVRKNGLTLMKDSKAITVRYDFPEDGFTVPLVYKLEEDGFSAAIDVSEIMVSDENLLIQRIHFLPFYAAAGQREVGYSMVPDGSGALIRFNNQKNTVSNLSLRVYGEDRGILQNNQLLITQPVHLPVFGMNKAEGGFLAIITGSEAVAQIESYVSGMVTGYNNTYASFLLRNNDVYPITDRTGNTREIRVMDENPGDLSTLSVRYCLLDASASDYVSMAARYRTYLTDELRVEGSDSAWNPLYLTFYGATEKVKPFLGFPSRWCSP
jgi:hypothetical protein